MCAYVHHRKYYNIPSSSIDNSPKLETTQMPTNSKMNKQAVVYSYNKILHSMKIITLLPCITGWMTSQT